jgi:hypothetical protein
MTDKNPWCGNALLDKLRSRAAGDITGTTRVTIEELNQLAKDCEIRRSVDGLSGAYRPLTKEYVLELEAENNRLHNLLANAGDQGHLAAAQDVANKEGVNGG